MDYHSLIPIAAIVIVFVAFWFVLKEFKAPVKIERKTFKVRLLYFDKDAWLCHFETGTDVGRGFVYLPEEGHYAGEEVEVTYEGKEVLELFSPVKKEEY